MVASGHDVARTRGMRTVARRALSTHVGPGYRVETCLACEHRARPGARRDCRGDGCEIRTIA